MEHEKKFICINSEVISRKLEDKMFIFRPAENKLYTLNDIGTEIWEHLDKKITIEDIVSIISEKFNIGQEYIQNDVVDFAEELRANGLVTIADS